MHSTLSRFAVAALVLSVFAVPTSASAAACNGSAKLCARTLDKVVLPGTHNSMSTKEDRWGIPNQGLTMAHQMSKGIRAMLFDTHYVVPDTIDFLGKKVTLIRTANETTPNRQAYFCHVSCESGAYPIATGLKAIADFLKSHPREVMVFVNESYITPADFAAGVTASGLSKYLYTGSTTTYPTLSKMISTKQRAVMFSEGATGTVPWYHSAYAGPLQETPYSFLTSNLLTDPSKLASSCVPNRGGTTGPMFLMNHFVTPPVGNTYAADLVSAAGAVNGKATIVARARACQTARGKLPNIIAVDQSQLGDVVGAAKSLNGL